MSNDCDTRKPTAPEPQAPRGQAVATTTATHPWAVINEPVKPPKWLIEARARVRAAIDRQPPRPTPEPQSAEALREQEDIARMLDEGAVCSTPPACPDCGRPMCVALRLVCEGCVERPLTSAVAAAEARWRYAGRDEGLRLVREVAHRLRDREREAAKDGRLDEIDRVIRAARGALADEVAAEIGRLMEATER